MRSAPGFGPNSGTSSVSAARHGPDTARSASAAREPRRAAQWNAAAAGLAFLVAGRANIGPAPLAIARDRIGQDRAQQNRSKNDRKDPAACFFHALRLTPFPRQQSRLLAVSFTAGPLPAPHAPSRAPAPARAVSRQGAATRSALSSPLVGCAAPRRWRPRHRLAGVPAAPRESRATPPARTPGKAPRRGA